MQVDPDFQAGLSRPSNALIKVLCSPLDIRISFVLLKGPVAYGYANGVEAIVGDFLEVGQGDPTAPVALKDVASIGCLLAQRVLVDYATAKLIKNRRRNPRLQDEPAPEVDTLDLGGPIWKLTFRHRGTVTIVSQINTF